MKFDFGEVGRKRIEGWEGQAKVCFGVFRYF